MVARVSPQIIVLGASAAAVSGAADTNENTLASIPLPAGIMGLNGILRIYAQFSTTVNVNGKQLRIRHSGIGGTAILNVNNANLSTYLAWVGIANRGVANAQSHFYFQQNGSSPTGTSGSVDTSLSGSIVITGQKTVAGDAITLESYLVELLTP